MTIDRWWETESKTGWVFWEKGEEDAIKVCVKKWKADRAGKGRGGGPSCEGEGRKNWGG